MKNIRFILLLFIFVINSQISYCYELKDYYLKSADGGIRDLGKCHSDELFFFKLLFGRAEERNLLEILYPDKIVLVNKYTGVSTYESVKEILLIVFDEYKTMSVLPVIKDFVNKKVDPLIETMLNTKTSKGNSIRIGYWEYFVLSSRRLADSKIKEFNMFNEPSNYSYLGIRLEATNYAKDSSLLPPIKLVDGNGNVYDPAHVVGGKGYSEKVLNFERVNPSLSVTGWVIFDVPQNEKYTLKLSGGYWSDEIGYIELN